MRVTGAVGIAGAIFFAVFVMRCAPFGTTAGSSSDAGVSSGDADGGFGSGQDAAIAFVRVVPKAFPDAGIATIDFGEVNAHDALIVAFDYSANIDLVQLTDSAGDTFSLTPNPPHRVADSGRQGIATSLDVKGGPTIITMTVGEAPTPMAYFDVYTHEYAGIATPDLVRVNDGTGAPGLAVTSGIGTTSAAPELLFGFGAGHVPLLPGNNFNGRSTFNRNVTEDRVVMATGPYDATAVVAGQSTGSWTMLMATFRGR
jgi:hypothetical protein